MVGRFDRDDPSVRYRAADEPEVGSVTDEIGDEPSLAGEKWGILEAQQGLPDPRGHCSIACASARRVKARTRSLRYSAEPWMSSMGSTSRAATSAASANALPEAGPPLR